MNKFKKIYLEITNVCNLNCNFCPKTKRAYKFLEIEDFKKRLKEIKPYTKYIYFHLMGEPLLHPNLKEFLDLAYEEGFLVNITTNGTLLKKNKEILLNAKGLRQINISLHSFEANDSEVDFNEYLRDVIEFNHEAHERTNIIISLRLWNLDNYELKGENNLNHDIISILEKEFNYEDNLKETLERDKRVKLRKNHYLNSAEKFAWPDINVEILGETGFCHGLRDHIGILVDGTVVPCCLDSEGNIPLGNINDNSLEEILNSERALKIYNGFSERKRIEELCKRCGYSDRFKK